jgi:thiol-disulfide isomerase/thioredoxin
LLSKDSSGRSSLSALVSPDARIHAPELTGALEWFNVPAPLTLAALRGKLVLLDFWTYGCVNCMHILPDLKRLESKYRDALVVIGIHSAKFANERRSENIRRIIVRYEIEHPVANDAAFEIWKAYGARAWPTQVLIDPEGYVVATASGEGHADGLDRAIAAVIQVFEAQGTLNRTPLPLSLERQRLAGSTLAFPGKVLVDERSARMFVADSNHNRVLVATLDGRLLDTIGGSEPANVDGPFEHARLFRPQGLALDTETLYIADTENHLIRAANLVTRRVTRVAGTGRQAAWGGQGGRAGETALSSPWDLQLARGLLFVAMAGTHQIWVIDVARQLALPYAGSGREARVDGSADDAAFAQPSGLAAHDTTLYVADSESNIIRAIELPPVNHVTTLAGGDLFDFGDVDGVGDQVRLQHPLGIVWIDGRLFVADTYNHRIKVMTPADRRVRAFAGDGQPGYLDGAPEQARFYEPGGLAATSTDLYVADTNNHAIRRVRLADGTVRTVEIKHP